MGGRLSYSLVTDGDPGPDRKAVPSMILEHPRVAREEGRAEHALRARPGRPRGRQCIASGKEPLVAVETLQHL